MRLLENKFPRHLVVRATKCRNLPLFYFIALPCFTLFVAFGAANPVLAYNANNFHWWQLLSAHFIHYDIKHLSLNMVALLILFYLFPSKAQTVIVSFIVALLFIDAYLLLANIQFYIGFSGLLYVIPGIAMGQFFIKKHIIYALTILGIYLLYTSLSYFTIHNSNGILWTPLNQAHCCGFFAGLITRTKTII